MKIIAMSDMHGQLPDISNINDVECMFICGDIVPLNIQTNIPVSLLWLEHIFMSWLDTIKLSGDIFIIAGNHDFVFERKPSEVKQLLESNKKVHYLCNENYEYLANDCITKWNIFGTPDCSIFGNWPFMYSPELELEHFNRMSDNVDIVLSHDACYGRNDQCYGIKYFPTDHKGNHELLEVIKKKKPLYQFTGHLHTSSHTLTEYNGTKTACVSLLNESYIMDEKPLVIDIEKENTI